MIVVVALANHPPAARGSGPEIGIWLALGGTVALVAGAALSRARISLVISRRATDEESAQPAPPPPPEPQVDTESATQTLPRQG